MIKITNEIIKILELLSVKNSIIKAYGEEFVRVDEAGIYLIGQNLMEKINSSNEVEGAFLDYQIFFQEISMQITSIDHVGIRYACPDIHQELEFYKGIISGTNFELVEEPNPEIEPRWFFIRHKEDLKAPMFEIVLYESQHEVVDEWTPHFQIDLNTLLSIEALHEKTNALLEQGFIRWQLGVPGVGVVLTMGIIGCYGNTKVFNGLGTDRRNVKVRNKTLKRM